MDRQSLQVVSSNNCELTLERTFAAPRGLVFQCWAQPDLVQRWLDSPQTWLRVRSNINLHPGAVYRFEWDAADSSSQPGILREIAVPRLPALQPGVSHPDGARSAVLTLAGQDRGAHMRIGLRYGSPQALDAAQQPDGLAAVSHSYDRLDALLQALQPRAHRNTSQEAGDAPL